MRPFPLTPRETINAVCRQVSKLEEVGLTHNNAIQVVAQTLKVEPYKIAALAASEDKEGRS
jgi:hypothetical protein